MDIFTTQIAQASPMIHEPIKAEKLKVKALVKDARLGKLKKESRELDENDYALYQYKDNHEQTSSEQQTMEQEVVELSEKAIELEQQVEHSSHTLAQPTTATDALMSSPYKTVNLNVSKKKIEKILKNKPHLDIFI